MLPVLQPAQMGCDHRADRSGVGGAVSVAADVAKDGTDVQAGAATDAMEGVALLGIREQFRATIIQEHDMILFRSVGLAWLPRPPIKRVVTGERLTRSE